MNLFRLIIIVLVMTAGSALVMWMGELVTERGVGNGMSLLIFAGIAARIPSEGKTILDGRGGMVFTLVCIAALIIIVGVVFVEQGSAVSRCSTPSGWSAGACTAARPRTCR